MNFNPDVRSSLSYYISVDSMEAVKEPAGKKPDHFTFRTLAESD